MTQISRRIILLIALTFISLNLAHGKYLSSRIISVFFCSRSLQQYRNPLLDIGLCQSFFVCGTYNLPGLRCRNFIPLRANMKQLYISYHHYISLSQSATAHRPRQVRAKNGTNSCQSSTLGRRAGETRRTEDAAACVLQSQQPDGYPAIGRLVTYEYEME